MNPKPIPTVFHVTHIKSGSQWVREILKYSSPERIVTPKPKVSQFFNKPVLSGKIYPTIYASRNRFENVLSKQTDDFQYHRDPHIVFVVMRDLRDTLISLYFSFKESHVIMSDIMSSRRQVLSQMDTEEGLMYVMDEALGNVANIQKSWCQFDGLIVKYEDLVANEFQIFKKIIDYCKIDVPKEKLRDIVSNNNFKKVTGRDQGMEDTTSHYRKGIAGDWRNHFTEKVKARFKKMFGDILIKTGYENDFGW